MNERPSQISTQVKHKKINKCPGHLFESLWYASFWFIGNSACLCSSVARFVQGNDLKTEEDVHVFISINAG